GGIDPCVANVATAAAYIMASQAPYGVTRGIVLGLLVGVAVGLVNGVGVAVFRVQPLIMTLAMGLVVTGSLNVYSQAAIRSVPGVPAVIHAVGLATVLGYVPVSGCLWGPLAALILTVLNSVLTLLDVPDAVKQILYGAIIVLLAAAYTRVLSPE